MTLFKKTSICIVILFFFLSLIPVKIYSKEIEFEIEPIEPVERIKLIDSTVVNKKYLYLFFKAEQNYDPIVYQDTVILFSPLLPIIFDGNHLNLTLPETSVLSFLKPVTPPISISKHKLFSDANNKNEINRHAYNYMIRNNLKQIRYTTADFTGKAEKIEAMGSNVFQHIFKIDYDFNRDNITKPDRFYPKRRYWTYNGNHKIQLSQNYISENWYKGGIKNLNLLNRHDITFNYKKNKFQANNTIEWRINLYTNPNDTLRTYRIGEDLVRMYSDFGIQAFTNWYYSSSIEIKTQIFKNFKENSEQAISSALSPLYINLGLLGMKYQLVKSYPNVKGKKIDFKTEISPLSVEYVTVIKKDIDPTRFGIKEGKRYLSNYGSSVKANLRFDFNRNVNFISRLYYFTNYHKVTAEWENTLNLPINRYFSTSIYLFFRYDDNPKLKRDKNLGYFQLNELLSFGFNYNW